MVEVMYRGIALGENALDTCESKQARVGAPDYPYGQRSEWTADAQRYANKLLSKSGRPPVASDGILDAKSCLAFGLLCDEQWKLMGPTTLRPDFLVDRTNCDQIPCHVTTCSHVDSGSGKTVIGLLLLGGLIAAVAYSQRGKL
jgi:hypothetical protein